MYIYNIYFFILKKPRDTTHLKWGHGPVTFLSKPPAQPFPSPFPSPTPTPLPHLVSLYSLHPPPCLLHPPSQQGLVHLPELSYEPVLSSYVCILHPFHSTRYTSSICLSIPYNNLVYSPIQTPYVYFSSYWLPYVWNTLQFLSLVFVILTRLAAYISWKYILKKY